MKIHCKIGTHSLTTAWALTSKKFGARARRKAIVVGDKFAVRECREGKYATPISVRCWDIRDLGGWLCYFLERL